MTKNIDEQTSDLSKGEVKTRSPGRPGNKTKLREKVLDEAELAFAEKGFSGTTTRDIASRAGVNTNLIRYYFETKQFLFNEVIRRRGAILSGHRHVLLDRLIANNPNHTLEDLIRAYIQPQWDTKHSGPGGAAFIRLQARLHAEPNKQSLDLRREVYDAALRRYISVVEPLLPHLTRETISLRWAFLVGTYLFMLNDLGRVEDISDGVITDLSNNEMLDNLVGFLAAGFKAPM
jgi:AcrR family transcriptional regulator